MKSRIQQHGSTYSADRRPLRLWDSNSIFRTWVMLHIKLKEIMNAATWLHIFCPQSPLPKYTHQNN